MTTSVNSPSEAGIGRNPRSRSDLTGKALILEKEYTGSGGMVAWYPSRGLAERLALGQGEAPDELHLTLCYFPGFATVPVDETMDVLRRLTEFTGGPLRGEISGVGRFSLPEEDAVVALVDVPGLSELRAALTVLLEERGIEIAANHGFLPHITLAYIPTTQRRLPVERLEPLSVTIGELVLKAPDDVVGAVTLLAGEKAQGGRAGPFEQDRLKAERKLELAVRRALAAIFQNVWRQLTREARAAGRKDVQDVPGDEQFWGMQRQEFMSHLGTVPYDLMLEGVRQAERLGLAVSFDLVNEGVLQLAGEYRNAWWDGLSTTTRNQMRTAIQAHIASGAPMPVLRQQLEPMFGRARARAIATTETTRLYAEGNRQAYAAAGVGEVEWRSVSDTRVDPICEDLDGKRMPLGQEEIVPPAHVSCRCWVSPVVNGKPLTGIEV